MKNNFNNKKTSSFKSECKIINLKYEYEGYTGKEKWAIITALSEEEILKKYADIINRYIPYVFLNKEQGAVIIESQNNDAKFRMRGLLYGHAFDVNDNEFEEHHPEFAFNKDMVEQIVLNDNIKKLKVAVENLPETQKRRIIKYFFEGKTYIQIGEEEGVYFGAIRDSIFTAVKNLKKFFK